MMTPSERVVALVQMEQVVQTFYRQAQAIKNHPFLEFAGVMTAYVNSCRAANERGIDFSDCNVHSGSLLPIESFEITYLNEKLNCIFGGRIVAMSDEGPNPSMSEETRDIFEPTPDPAVAIQRAAALRASSLVGATQS